MFDEPSSYLDVKQRLNAARIIRSLLTPTCYVIVVEHDLSVLDYLSDYICVLYGMPSAYGVVTLPFSVREGNNIYIALKKKLKKRTTWSKFIIFIDIYYQYLFLFLFLLTIFYSLLALLFFFLLKNN